MLIPSIIEISKKKYNRYKKMYIKKQNIQK